MRHRQVPASFADDGSEGVDLLDRHDVVAHVPALATALERLDHLLDGADEDRPGLSSTSSGVGLERACHHLAIGCERRR